MTFYERMDALVVRQLASKGFSATFRGEPTPADPVTGVGGSDGATRTIQAVKVAVNFRDFPETLVEAGDLMLIVKGFVEVGEYWIDGSDHWRVVSVKQYEPDNSTDLMTKALVRG